jgi:hypothetical protein
MLHAKRTWAVYPVETAEELASLVTSSWTLCSAFEFAGLLFLNDSTSEDGAQEYAVIYEGFPIEPVSFGWCGFEAALRHILHVTAHADELLKEPWSHPVEARVEDWETHRCRHCR